MKVRNKYADFHFQPLMKLPHHEQAEIDKICERTRNRNWNLPG